jgi:hypothetical protein
MLWVTRHTIRINRSATAWLIRRFIDPAATFASSRRRRSWRRSAAPGHEQLAAANLRARWPPRRAAAEIAELEVLAR